MKLTNSAPNVSQQNLSDKPFLGQKWLVEERDACGVGFIAYQDGRQSNKIVNQALKALGCMEHRGGCSADLNSGDGAGIMTALPHKLFATWFAQENMPQPEPEAWGVGMVFLPQDADQIKELKNYIEKIIESEQLQVLGWRIVPVNPEVLGQQARDNQPHIEQIVVSSTEGLRGDNLERKLYVARSRVGKKLSDNFYICSFSCRTIVYKGMVRSVILGEFYQDLVNPDYESTFAVYHRRFSTNTMPKWPFAQPMRILGHNGEINTLLGNINWMSNRERELVANEAVTRAAWTQAEVEGLTPIVNNDNSDSYNLDSAMELLVRSGRSITESAMILVPEAYHNQPSLAQYPEIVDFYEYHSGQQEPWDGPALLVFSDGKTVGAVLDRNGLRPARYTITKDGYIVVGSETGVVDLPDDEVVEKGRLGPGQTIVVDLQTKEILRNWEVKQRVAQANPYGKWIEQYRQTIEPQEFGSENLLSADDLLRRQTAFGYTAEDVELIIESMAINGKEPTFCMGDDIPLAVLSDKPRLLYDYFKQRFAQVTNPAIDPLRESLVMSLSMQLGAKGHILDLKPEDAKLLKLE
ncbi:MAG: glutamate synthase central domain-containing protein, partial [Cyanobacteria bacterium P01_A01_bin.83]